MRACRQCRIAHFPGSRDVFCLTIRVKISRLKFVIVPYFVGVLLMYGAVTWQARELVWKGYPDFTIYYTAAMILRRGLGPHLYEEATQFKIQREFAPGVVTRVGALPYNHPPFEALVFVPFSYLPYRTAFILWDVMNAGILISLPFLLRRYLPVVDRLSPSWWILTNFAFFPFFFALLQGQDTILLLLLYTLAFICLEKKRFVAAGACLACGLFKFHLVLPFLILLLIREKKKVLSGFLLVSAALGLIGVALVGWHQIIYYPLYVLRLEETMARGAIMPQDMPNLRGILYLISPRIPNAFVLFLSIAVFLIGVAGSRGKEQSHLKFAFGIFLTVLVSYHALGYDLSILMLGIFLLANDLLDREEPSHWSGLLIVGCIAILFFAPLMLVLLMKYQRLAFTGWAVLFATCGILGQILHRQRQHAAADAPLDAG
jgi:hypothetical protein